MNERRPLSIRVSAHDLSKINDISQATKQSSADVIRRFISDGLADFDAKHEDLVSHLVSLQEQLSEIQGDVAKSMAIAEIAGHLSAANLALLSSVEIPRITGTSREAIVERIKTNLVYAVGLGVKVRDRYESGELLQKD